MSNTRDHSGTHAMAHLDLMPVDASGHAALATHVVAHDGDWFDTGTWTDGQVPGEGALVHIPDGISVTYQGQSDASLFLLRIDGALSVRAEDGVATKMVVDTIITSDTSYLGVKAQDASDGTVDIIFRQGSPAQHRDHFTDHSGGDGVIGRHDWDPDQLGLGLVASGRVDIKGQAVDVGLQLATGPRAGATELVFDLPADDPNWAIGQQVVVGGTTFSAADAHGTMAIQDEVRTITAIDAVNGQMIVSLDRPLVHDHMGPRDPETGAELTGHVGNLTRNVTLSSAAADRDGDGMPGRALSLGQSAGPDDHFVTERAHTMFMHNDDVSILNTAFFGLGRTDKSRPVDDIVTGGPNDHRILQDNGSAGVYDPEQDTVLETPAHQMTNPRGRYAVHLHEANGQGAVSHAHGSGDPAHDGPAMLGPCAKTGDPICLCADQDGDGIADCEDPDYFDGAWLQGNVVWGSPGWGIVQHSSNAVLAGNLVYEVAGSAFVAELGDEAGRWDGNLAIGTYGVDDRTSAEDAEQFNEDGGTSGNGFYMKSRILEVMDNVAQSSGRAGFFYHSEGGGLRDPAVDDLGDLSGLGIGGTPVDTEALPIRSFAGNSVIAAREGLRLLADPSDSVRKMNDAWSTMRDFLAWEIDEAGVSITYSSKYIFEDFTILGTMEKQSASAQPASAGFFFKASVADITVLNSHVENFLNAVTNWTQIGDRQEYRRGYWDPKDPTDLNNAPSYEGMGAVEGIENPAHNLWNTNVVGLTWDNIPGVVVRSRNMAVETDPGTIEEMRGTQRWTSEDDVPNAPGVQIDLIGDSNAGGLVALWREGIAAHPDQRAMLAQHIPLAYDEDVYLGQVMLSGQANPLIRQTYLDHIQGINADIWSGTVLEFAKTDSLGRQVFLYGDFAPLNPEEAVRAVTTNERIVLTREMVDAILVTNGYHTVHGVSDVAFIVVDVAFTDRLTGQMEPRQILIALDTAWNMPAGARDGGMLLVTDVMIVADQYRVFRNGVLDTDRAPIVLGAAPDGVPSYDTGVFTTDSDDDLGLGAGADSIRAGGGDDIIRGFAASDVLDGGDGRDALFGGAGWDRLSGGADDDLLDGATQRDVLNGGDGNDRLQGGAGHDQLDGGAGHDVELGGVGNDTLLGRSGDDVLDGGDGRDQVQGGAGHDRVSGGLGRDTLDGGAGDDVIAGQAGADRMQGGDGNDRMNGGAGADTMAGGTGIDVMIGGSGADVMSGGAGGDTLTGNVGRDTLDGGAGDDVLQGSGGADILFGGDGTDILSGGRGRDQLTGGAGADRFVFRADSGKDVVTDFQIGVDSIEFLIESFGFDDLVVVHDGPDAVLHHAAGQHLRLVGVDGATVTESDFVFLPPA